MADVGEPPPSLCPLCGHPASFSVSPPMSAAAANTSPARPPLKRRTPPVPEAPPAVVRVEIGDEAAALREALARQQAALDDVQAELDAERGAAAGAASEAMTMILRLQREKAEAMMEARQFRRYAEEKMAHDATELAALEEALSKREAAGTRALQGQTPRQPYGAAPSTGGSTPRRPSATPRHPPSSPSPAASSGGGAGGYYPPLRCCIDHPPTASEADALETPRDQLTRLAHRVHLLERGATPVAAANTTPIIRVAPGSSFPRHARAYSDDSLDLYNDGDCFPDDDCGASDRVYTVDAIHGATLAVPEGGSYGGGGTPLGSDCGYSSAPWTEDEEVRRLSARMQALEADRESMRQAIISMGAEKAQVMLLKEIAQKLCKEAAPPPVPAAAVAQQSFYKGGNTQPAMTVTVRPPRHPPVLMQRKVVKRQPSLFAAVVKWVTSIMWWRRKSSRVKYPIGQCGNNVGLLLLLDKAPRASGHGHQRPPKRI
ncbi:myosin-binding protein 7-like [Miscanthus floridulus]|uniref:myosin-binding protein 7-like n=1 Tax=Miscanthus floridulus TaxID=154761 RepID=UPI0034599620